MNTTRYFVVAILAIYFFFLCRAESRGFKQRTEVVKGVALPLKKLTGYERIGELSFFNGKRAIVARSLGHQKRTRINLTRRLNKVKRSLQKSKNTKHKKSGFMSGVVSFFNKL